MLDEEFKLCAHCGETFFKEDIDKKGLCKCCNGTHERMKIDEISDSDL